MRQICRGSSLRVAAGTCIRPTLASRGYKAFALGLLVLLAMAAPAVAATGDSCNAPINCGPDPNFPCAVATCVLNRCVYATPAPSSTVCRPAANVCDVADTCDGLTLVCPVIDQKRGAETVCRGSEGLCDTPDRCDGVNNACPTDAKEPAGTVCRPAAGVCDRAEVCDGVNNSCLADAKRTGEVCRPTPTDRFNCDFPEFCGTTNDCPADAPAPAGYVCRASDGVCDPAETCNGTSFECPTAVVYGPETVCRPATGPCDREERCVGGTANQCPPEGFTGSQPSGTSCTDGNACNGAETCNGSGTCSPGSPLTCNDGNACNGVETCSPTSGCSPGTAPTCNDGNACNGVETCSPATGCVAGTPVTCGDGNACNGTETCNTSTGACQAGTPVSCGDGNACNGVETCNPASGLCQSGTPVTCGDGNACNGTETCNTSTGACQAGTPVSCGDGNACNGVESCNPTTGACQAGTPVTCGDGNVCNGAETCNPTSGQCQAGTPLTCADDGNACTTNSCNPTQGCVATPAPSTTVCRPAAQGAACDRAEFCTGTTTTCPNDTFEPAGTVCRSASGQCDVAETCNGTSGYCPVNGFKANGTSCDDGAFCTGPNNSDTCNQGVCSGPANTCSDGNVCTTDTCNEATNRCEQSGSTSSTCDGAMSGGGQIGCPDCNAGKCHKHDNRNKASFGFYAHGQAQVAQHRRGGARGRFLYYNHGNGVGIWGPVTFIHYAVPTANGGEMKFEVSARQHRRDEDRRDKWEDDDEDNDCSHICKYNVTAKDQVDPGDRPPYDFLKVEYVSGSCAQENTGDQPLKKGNIQWHERRNHSHGDTDHCHDDH